MEEDENDMSDDDDDIYFIDELGNVVFPVEDDVVELEEECFTDGATGAVAVSGGGAQWCSCAVSDGMASPELRRQSQVRETSLGDDGDDVQVINYYHYFQKTLHQGNRWAIRAFIRTNFDDIFRRTRIK